MGGSSGPAVTLCGDLAGPKLALSSPADCAPFISTAVTPQPPRQLQGQGQPQGEKVSDKRQIQSPVLNSSFHSFPLPRHTLHNRHATMIPSMKSVFTLSLGLAAVARAQYDAALVGTWTTKSKKVLTGPVCQTWIKPTRAVVSRNLTYNRVSTILSQTD